MGQKGKSFTLRQSGTGWRLNCSNKQIEIHKIHLGDIGELFALMCVAGPHH